MIGPMDGTVLTVTSGARRPSGNWTEGWVDYGYDGYIEK